LTLVEAAAETLQSVLAAEHAGAGRIELCANLKDGGTTPSAELTTAVMEQCRIPVLVMIRARAGSFVYTESELDAMVRDIELAHNMGVAGIVTGALAADGSVNIAQTRALFDAANGLPVTFHRAFDLTPNLDEALEQLVGLRATRILTSGGAATALEGSDTIAALVDQASGRITVVAGGGIRAHNVRELIERTAVTEVHARILEERQMRDLVSTAG